MKTVGYLDKDYGLIFPILTVSYERSYFDYKKMRITFDENIEYSADDYFNYINKRILSRIRNKTSLIHLMIIY